jgi:hypothetical protein
MSDKFVTVAKYNNNFEAQLAKNLLENEGLECIIGGAFSSDILFSGLAAADPIVLQVRVEDAERASMALAAVEAARLDEDWEQQAESDSGVWICSICGEPISNRLSMCYSCQTPREGIRTSAPRDQTAIQEAPVTVPAVEADQTRDEIVCTPAPAPSLAPAHGKEEGMRKQELLTAAGNDLARRALIASICWVLLPLAWFYLYKLIFFPCELSRKGMLYLYGALLFNGLFILVLVLLVVWF